VPINVIGSSAEAVSSMAIAKYKASGNTLNEKMRCMLKLQCVESDVFPWKTRQNVIS
jgi:hypothetical protein